MNIPDDSGDGNENRWTNWAGNLSSVPDAIERPASVADVQALVARSRGTTLRMIGTGHSFSPLIVNNGETLVDMSNFAKGSRKAWRWQDKGIDLVSFLPSASWAEVRDALTAPDPTLPQMYLSSTGALASINATGFIAAGCHGTGWHQRTVSDFVHAIEFVAADGQLHVFSEDTAPNEMAAARVSLGTLGVITKVTLQVEPLYNLHDEEIVTATESVMGPNPQSTGGEIRPQNLHKLVTGNEYVELFWFPGSGYNNGQIWIKKFNRTTDEPRDIPLRPDGWIDKMATAVMGWTATHPLLWPPILSMAWDTISDRAKAIEAKGGFVAPAPRVLFYADQAFPILDLEVAIPIPATGPGTWNVGNVVRAWYAALNYAYKFQGDFPLTTCLHARFTRTSPALLSPAFSTAADDRVCWMEILSAYPKSEPDANKRAQAMASHLAMINAVMSDWIGARHGRPHWAKNWQYITPHVDVKALYPQDNLSRFNTLRRQLDPGGMFLNHFLSQQGLFS
jgi:FAD/FMN-containing dehydrogenase